MTRPKAQNRSKLIEAWLHLLDSCFDLDEIKTLCLLLSIDFENLSGVKKSSKIRELILHAIRSGRMDDLKRKVASQRPKVTWPEIPASELSSHHNNPEGAAPTKSGLEVNINIESQAKVHISILFLAADPSNASRLRLSEEFREIQEKLKRAKLRDNFRLELPQLSVRPEDISQAMLDTQDVRLQIVHFSGHGTDTGALCFENHAGKTHLVQPSALASLFEEFVSQISCVLLNACYSETQAKAIADHIEYVIGMKQAIGDKAAIAFAIGFYQALGAGRTIEEAYKLGCVQIRLQNIPEHLTPVLFKKGEGKLFPQASSNPHPPSERKHEEPYLPFANREVEIDEIVKYHEGSYYLFEGPAGYGKTRLLLEIKRRLVSDERNWLCVYVPLPKCNGFEEVVKYVVDSLGLDTKTYRIDQPHLTGVELGKDIARLRDERQSEGFCLLLDIDKEPFEYLVNNAKEIIGEFSRGLFDGLTYDTESFFGSNEKTFKLVVAGRYLTTDVYSQFADKKFKPIRLKPFDYTIVRKICLQFPFKSEADRDDFAAQLLFYSGGHPGCMAEILDTIKKREPNKPLNFLSSYGPDMETIAGREASAVRASIVPSLRETFDVLSVYPRFDYSTIDKLIESKDISHTSDEDGYDLTMQLRRSFLIDWADDHRLHCSDGITRHLLAIGLRYNHPKRFQDLCQQAYENCNARIEEASELRFQWAVEALATFLQISTNQIQDAAVRSELKTQFFDEILPNTLNKLVEVQDKRLIREPFLGAAEQHPDLKFMLNYYLKDKTYSDDPYQKFVEKVEQFFN